MNKIHAIANMVDKNNKNVLLAPLSNIKSITEGKHGCGFVEIAIPNDVAHKLSVDTNKFIGGLLLVDRAEFEKEMAGAE